MINLKKTIFIFLSFYSCLTLAQHQLKVEIKGFKNNKGLAQIALYQSAAQFLQKPYITATVPINAGKATAIFETLPKGIYALAIFHDENSNNKMDLGLFGIPKEAYVFSNHAKAFMSAPKFEAAKFQLNQNEVIVLKIN